MEFGTILAIFLTLAAYSFLYKDNLLFKFAEHIFIGVAAGYIVVVQYHSNFLDNLWEPLIGEGLGPLFTGGDPSAKALLLLIPFAFGLLLLSKFVPNVRWLNRWPLSLVIGSFAGLAIIGFGSGDFILQVKANILPFFREGAIDGFLSAPGLFSFLELVYNPILILGVPCALLYFFFSREHTGALGKVTRVGTWFLMISFGASYGNTVMTRVSLAIERADSLITEGWTSVVMLLIVIGLMVALHFAQRSDEPVA